MTRHLVALAAALCFSGSQAFAQDIVMTVGAGSADVYKAPTTASPIVGHALGGMVLDVSRELGSWVKVTWPGAPDGAGYVHVSKGTVGPRKPADVARVGAAAPAPAPAPVATAPARTEPTTTVESGGVDAPCLRNACHAHRRPGRHDGRRHDGLRRIGARLVAQAYRRADRRLSLRDGRRAGDPARHVAPVRTERAVLPARHGDGLRVAAARTWDPASTSGNRR